MALRNITISGLSIQFDGECAEGDHSKAMALANRVIYQINDALCASGLESQPQVYYGGDNVKLQDEQIEIGDSILDEDDNGV